MDVSNLIAELRRAAEDGKTVLTAKQLHERLRWRTEQFRAILLTAIHSGAVTRKRACINGRRVAVVALPEYGHHIGDALAELRARRYSPRRPAARSRQPGRVRSK